MSKHRLIVADARAGDTTAQWELERFNKLNEWIRVALIESTRTEHGDGSSTFDLIANPMTVDDVAAVIRRAFRELQENPIKPEMISQAFELRGAPHRPPGAPISQIVLVVCHPEVSALGITITDDDTPGGAWFSLRPWHPRAVHVLDQWRMNAYGGVGDKGRVHGTLTEFMLHWAEFVGGAL